MPVEQKVTVPACGASSNRPYRAIGDDDDLGNERQAVEVLVQILSAGGILPTRTTLGVASRSMGMVVPLPKCV